MKRNTFTLVMLALMTLLSGCIIDLTSFDWDDYRYSYPNTMQEQAEGIERISLNLKNSKMTFQAAETDTIDLEIEKRIKARDEEAADELAEKIQIVSRVEGGTLTVEAEFDGDERELRRHFAAVINVTLPENIAVRARSVNGSITAEWITAGIEMSTTNGSITLENCGGDSRLETTNGSIKVNDSPIAVQARTTNGSIKLYGVSSALASTTNGSIQVSIEPTLTDDIDLSTTNGRIRLALPEDTSFELDADTANGRIENEFDGDFETNKRRTRMSGTVGDGQYRVQLDTTNGSIGISIIK